MTIPNDTVKQFPWPAVQLSHVFDATLNQWVPQPAVEPVGPSQATHTAPTLTATSQVIAAANPHRRRLLLHNDSAGNVFVTFGPTSSPSAFSIRLGGQDGYAGPLGDYTGVVSAVRAAGSSVLQVTEVVT